MNIEIHNFFPHFGNDMLVTRIKKIEFQNFRNIENGFAEVKDTKGKSWEIDKTGQVIRELKCYNE